MINIFIADDHTLIREGIKKLLAQEIDIKLVGETSNPFEVVDQIVKSKCDILILDLSMPGKSGLDVLKEIKIIAPHVKVLIMTMLPEDQFAKRTLKAGASGYITKDRAGDELITAIRRVADGRKYVSQSLAELLVDDLDGTSQKPLHEILSDREFQILKMMAKGISQTAIADELSISISTVNTYRGRIFEKLNLHSNAELIHFAFQNNLNE
ncbi:MAG: DNA-binding response regulator [Ignavibacteria bacterium GWA2_35_9]|nr:MAG: DNA-binding response regulator [Ignavibacteria bacterium GWA2_35_9]